MPYSIIVKPSPQGCAIFFIILFYNRFYFPDQAVSFILERPSQQAVTTGVLYPPPWHVQLVYGSCFYPEALFLPNYIDREKATHSSAECAGTSEGFPKR